MGFGCCEKGELRKLKPIFRYVARIRGLGEKDIPALNKRSHLKMRCCDVMEKPGVEPGTFSTQQVHCCTMLRRCHTARPYPLSNQLLDRWVRSQNLGLYFSCRGNQIGTHGLIMTDAVMV